MSEQKIDKKIVFKLAIIVVALGAIGYKFLAPKFASASLSNTIENPITSEQQISAVDLLPPPPTVVTTKPNVILDSAETKQIRDLATKRLIADLELKTFQSEQDLKLAKEKANGKPTDDKAVNTVSTLSPIDNIVPSESYSTPVDEPFKSTDTSQFLEALKQPTAIQKPSTPSLIDEIALHGFITIKGKTTALISVNNGVPTPIPANGKIANTVTVERITPDGIRLREGSFVRTLSTVEGAK